MSETVCYFSHSAFNDFSHDPHHLRPSSKCSPRDWSCTLIRRRVPGCNLEGSQVLHTYLIASELLCSYKHTHTHRGADRTTKRRRGIVLIIRRVLREPLSRCSFEQRPGDSATRCCAGDRSCCMPESTLSVTASGDCLLQCLQASLTLF